MKKNVIITALLLLLLISPAMAEVVVFDKYDSTMEFDGDVLRVTKNLRLKNVGTNPIIPGEIHFKISQDVKGKDVSPDVQAFSVIDKFNKQIESRQVVTESEVDLIFTVWDPLLPDFFYDMTMTYELTFSPSGVLFYQVNLPEEKTTIPIKNSVTRFQVPTKYHVTYAPEAEVTKEDDNKVVTWASQGLYIVEYSYVPFPKTGVPAVNIFWVIIISLFLINLFLRLRKKAKMANRL